MAKEKKEAPPNPIITENDQFSDILLVMDNKELTLRAVSEIDKNGKAKMVDADEKNQNSFLRIDKFSSILENFISNFWRQAKDPTHFNLFRITMDEFKNNRQIIKDIKSGKQTPETEEFIKKYKLEKEINNQQNNKEMTKEKKKLQFKRRRRKNKSIVSMNQ